MLIFEQPNLSTCLVTLVIVLGIVFSAGISYRWIVGVLAVTIPMVGTCVYLLLHGLIPFIKEYQAGRILAWFYPDRYGEARYQQNNSIIAIGSGQLKVRDCLIQRSPLLKTEISFQKSRQTLSLP